MPAPETLEAFIERYGSKNVTYKALVNTTEAYTQLLRAQQKRIAALEVRIAELEKKSSLKFCGVYQSGQPYAAGDAVTRSGSLWICTAETTGVPGEDFAGWKLAVKKGSA